MLKSNLTYIRVFIFYIVCTCLVVLQNEFSIGVQVSDVFVESSFKVFADTLKSGGIIKALCVPSGVKSYSNTALKKGDIFNEAIKSGAKGLPFLKVSDSGKKRRFSFFLLFHFSLLQGGFLWSLCFTFNGFEILSGEVEGIAALASSLDPTKKEQLLTQCSAGPGDLILFAVGHPASVNKTLDRLRVFVAHELGLVDHVSTWSAFNCM